LDGEFIELGIRLANTEDRYAAFLFNPDWKIIENPFKNFPSGKIWR
jgi:hypothetical protein